MSVIAIGGGKGGVGRSLVASGLAVFIAQLGRKVLLVDGHPYAQHQARVFGVARANGSTAPWIVDSGAPRGAESTVANLRVLSASGELGALPGIALRRPREIARGAGVDQCVVDLAMGVGSACIDGMLDADAMVLVTTPEPVAVEAIYRFLRHAYARSLGRALHAFPLERDAVRRAIREAGGPPNPLRLAEHVARVSADGARAAWSTLSSLRARLVVNCSRSRADLDLGDAMAIVANQQMGMVVDHLGHVEYDESVVLAARRRRPLLVDVPGAKASRNLERIARRLLALEAGRGERVPSQPTEAQPEAMTHYQTLALDRGASDEEVRRAYRRLREIYSPDSIAVSGLMNESTLAFAIARIEEARDVLLDPARRRPYDLSITSADSLGWAEPPSALAAEEPAVRTGPAPEVTAETEFSGELLRAIRESRGVDLKDVAARTKISVMNLRALEAEEYGALPATVYLRGFVAEVAKFLHLDVEQVTRTYLRRYRRASQSPASRGRA